MFLRSLGYIAKFTLRTAIHYVAGELPWQPPNGIFSSFSTRIGIPGAIDIVVLSGEIFFTCFFLQCRNIGPKLTFCIFSLFHTNCHLQY